MMLAATLKPCTWKRKFVFGSFLHEMFDKNNFIYVDVKLKVMYWIKAMSLVTYIIHIFVLGHLTQI